MVPVLIVLCNIALAVEREGIEPSLSHYCFFSLRMRQYRCTTYSAQLSLFGAPLFVITLLGDVEVSAVTVLIHA